MVANAGGGTGASGSFLAPQVQPNVLSLPPRWRPGSQAAAAGLTNLGNSCYLNSTLQCLAFVPPLGHLCLSHGHSSTCARTRSGAGGGGGGAGAGAGGFSFGSSATSYGGLSGGGGGGGGACCTFCLVERQLGAMLRAPRGGCVSPGEVVRSLHLFGRSFVKGRQEDSHEFLTALLDVMERDGRRAAVALGAPKNVRTIVEDLFVGRWQSQVRCLACGHESNTYEAFATLPLDIAQARTVVEGLRVFTEAERLDGANKYRCDRCRQLVPAVKQTSIWDDPNVLVVHIKRFDGGCLLGGKLTRHVGFTDTLDLTRFMTAGQGQQQQQGPAASSNGGGGGGGGGGASSGGNPGQQHHHHHHQEHGHHHHTHHQHHHGGQHHGQHQQQQHGQQSHPHQPHDPGRSVYNLTGVLVHQGSSLHSGHYYAFVRDAGDRWALMNDSAVTPLASFAEVSREQAYMLFYTRTTMKRPREPPPAAPPPPPAAAAAAEAGVAAAGKAAAGVYGPQLPPGFARAASTPAAVAAAAAANGGGGGGSAASSAVSSGGSGGGQGLGALGSGRAVLPAAPTARLAARPSGSVAAAAAAAPSTAKLPAKFTITARASLDRAPSAAAAAADSAGEAAGPGPGRGTRSAPLTPAATTSSASAATTSAAAASASEAADADADTASPAAGDGLAGRKRKRPEASSSTGAAANGAAADGPGTGLTELPPGATASERRRAAVEAEVAAHKACASWGEGVKRLKGAMGGMLRRSEWAAAAAALMRSLKSSGLSLQEVVALPRSDERRRELNRVVPRGVLEHGRDELARLLRAALLQLGWLGLGASGSLLL